MYFSEESVFLIPRLVGTLQDKMSEDKSESTPPVVESDNLFIAVTLAEGVLEEGTSLEPLRLPFSHEDNVEALRFVIGEYCELHCESAYHFEVEVDGVFVPLAEFCEFQSFLTSADQKELNVKMVLDTYDEKKCREHTRIVREFIKYPPVADRTLDDGLSSSPSDAEKPSTVVNDKFRDKIAALAKPDVPKVEDALTEGVSPLASFYPELLYRTGEVDTASLPQSILSRLGVNTDVQLPSDCIKSICESGWSPPSPARRMQGDLIYVEVTTASEGILQITATAQGFFVNMSSRNHFDPRPSSKNPSFDHSLLGCLRKAVPAFGVSMGGTTRRLREASQAASRDGGASRGALSNFATLLAHGRGETVAKDLQWNVPPKEVTGGRVGASYDTNRTVAAAAGNSEDMAAAGLIDEKGPPREWNEDLQIARNFPRETLPEKTQRAKYIQKTYSDFEAVVKRGVVDIVEGKVASFNPIDSEQALVYLYQGIFYSGSTDTKDGFRVSQGDEASRKSAGQDLINMRRVEELDIDGLCTVLQAVTDYKGLRFTAQTVIPGILNQAIGTEGQARLMYGAIEAGVRLRVKKDAFPLMKELANKLHLSERNMPAIPIEKDKALAEAQAAAQEKLKAQLGSLATSESTEQASPVAIDDRDETSEISSPSVTHVGPVEGKIIRGCDGRMYALGLCRLTPRDANYVEDPRGTGLIPEDQLAQVDGDVIETYILRHELIEQFLYGKLDAARQVIIDKHMAQREEDMKALAAAEKERQEKGQEEDDETKAKRVKEQIESFQKFQKAINDELSNITLESVNSGFSVNPNVFYSHFNCDVDTDEVAKDEAVAKELASFLHDKMLPAVTKEIRESNGNYGSSVPLDNEAAVDLLHRYGINMRYLGKLASLARDGEARDYKMENVSGENQQSSAVFKMPTYWRDIVEVELVARAVRVLMTRLFRNNKEVCDCPAATIASLLSHVLATGAPAKESDADLPAPPVVSSGGEKKKKKKKGKGGRDDSKAASASPQMFLPPPPQDAASDRNATLDALDCILKSRFLYSLKDIRATTEEDAAEGDEKVEKKKNEEEMSAGPLGARLPRIMLLRRICQLLNLRVNTRDYDFAAPAGAFTADDIAGLSPRIKTGAPLHPLPEAKTMMAKSQECLKAGDLQTAYAFAVEAQNAVQQVIMSTGTISDHLIEATQNVVDVIQHATIGGGEDIRTALLYLTRNLDMSVMLHGLDNHHTITMHIQMAGLLTNIGKVEEALHHLQSALYAVKLISGSNHPIVVQILQRMAEARRALSPDNLNDTYTLLNMARGKCCNWPARAIISVSLGQILAQSGHLEQSIVELKHAHGVLEQIYGADDSKTKEVKEVLRSIQRQLTELKVNAARSRQDQVEKYKQEMLEKAKADAESKRQSEEARRRYQEALKNTRRRR